MTPTICLCISAFESIRAEAARWPGEETGGILGGYETEDAIVITHATGPGTACRRSPHSIVLDTAYLQEQTDLFATLGLQYQGSWHTHPTTGPLRPSRTDRRLLRSGAWSRRYRLELASVMLIARDSVAGANGIVALTCAKRGIRIARSTVVITRDATLSVPP